MPTAMPPELPAWHEAGHALAAHWLGGQVREVTLESDRDDLEGHTSVAWPRSPRGPEDDARRQALVSLAGPVAELVHRGVDVLDDVAVLLAWRGDWDHAELQLGRLHAVATERDRARHDVLAELVELFGSPAGYECLARVADALDAHGTLDGELFVEALQGRS